MIDKNPFTLEGKNIIITGASSGIGRECAILCSKMGAKVSLIARNQNRLNETLLHMQPIDLHQAIVFDVTEYDKIEEIIQSVVAKQGKIDGFIHCAGKERTIPTIAMKAAYYEEMYAVNVISAFEFAKHISKKKYCSENGCSMIFIASVMGTFGEVALVSYCATKGALIAGSKALAMEFAEKKIRVNTVSPAQIENTLMIEKLLADFSEENRMKILLKHPLGYGKPIDVANACIYLLSDSSRWVTGTNLIVDGGYSAK
jgi:NAD(P)-dependent dehydrogenase (short-subunit alcohol dehydrogenase family)